MRTILDFMSITFEFSFNTALELPLLVDAVNRALGTLLERDGDAASGVLLGSALVLELHQMEDDGELNFSDYRYQLWSKTWDGSGLRAIQLESLVLAALVLHNLVGISNGMLTYEGQRLLARYEVVDGRWSDTISGAVIDIPGHLAELQNRLDDAIA